MYEYKVFKWRFDLSSACELEEKLNEYVKEGWKIFDIITNMKGNASILMGSVDENETNVILERISDSN